MFTRLNQLNITISYCAVLKLGLAISKLNELPLRQWIESKAAIKFIGDNVDVGVGVRDIRSNHQKHLQHMFSLLVTKSRIPRTLINPNLPRPRSLLTLSSTCLLPTAADIATVKLNLSILVSRILCTYIKGLHKFKKVIPKHIMHRYSLLMAEKSEVAVLDVLYKNEVCHQDMLEIMKYIINYLGKEYRRKAISGGDLLTCERERCAQRHVMDSDSPTERLELIEPVVEDWHTLMCVLEVNYFTNHST